jgi:hypothetical protein
MQKVARIDEYLESWGRRLRARNRSEKTIRGYGETVQLFLQFLRCHDMPTVVGEVKREHVEAFIADQLARWKPTTAQHGTRRCGSSSSTWWTKGS